MGIDHDTVDFVRDAASNIVGGLVLLVLGGIAGYFRYVRTRLARCDDRLTRHGNEIRHTQTEAGIKGLYPEYPADKL